METWKLRGREDDLEGTRRLKTEFLVQLDGVSSAEEASILVIGATNRPQDLDEAARRRFVKRLYIPLPDAETRRALFGILLKKNENAIGEGEIEALVTRSEGYSCADIHNLCREAAMGPIREVSKRGGIAGMNVGRIKEGCEVAVESAAHLHGGLRVCLRTGASQRGEG